MGLVAAWGVVEEHPKHLLSVHESPQLGGSPVMISARGIYHRGTNHLRCIER